MFSAGTLKVLEEAGWVQSRNFDLTQYKEILEADGYTVFDSVHRFLTEFGGLVLLAPGMRRFHFDVQKVCVRTFPDTVQDLSEEMGTRLCPVGGDEPYTVLLMNDAGNLFMYNESKIVLLGESGELALERLCNEQNLLSGSAAER